MKRKFSVATRMALSFYKASRGYPLARVAFALCSLTFFSNVARAADTASGLWTQNLPELSFHNPFAACAKNCLFSIYAGQLVNTAMFDIFIKKHTMPWDWQYKDAYLVSGTFDRPVLTWGRHFEIDTEVGVGKRFGFLHEEEAWGAIYFRVKAFPWDKYIRTSVAASTGLDYASDIPAYELLRNANGHGDRLLHYLSPELTLGLPQYPDLDFVARFHHRSGGALPVFNHTGGGAQFGELGIRYRL